MVREDMEVVEDREVVLLMITTVAEVAEVVVVREVDVMMGMVEVVSKIRTVVDDRKTHMVEDVSKTHTVADAKKVKDMAEDDRKVEDMVAARMIATAEDDRKVEVASDINPITSVLKDPTLKAKDMEVAMDNQAEPPMVVEVSLPTTSPVQSRKLTPTPAHQETLTCSHLCLACSLVSTSKSRMRTWTRTMLSSSTRTFTEEVVVDMPHPETWVVPLLCRP